MELTAIVFAVEKSHHYIEGAKPVTTINTDPRPLDLLHDVDIYSAPNGRAVQMVERLLSFKLECR